MHPYVTWSVFHNGNGVTFSKHAPIQNSIQQNLFYAYFSGFHGEKIRMKREDVSPDRTFYNLKKSGFDVSKAVLAHHTSCEQKYLRSMFNMAMLLLKPWKHFRTEVRMLYFSNISFLFIYLFIQLP